MCNELITALRTCVDKDKDCLECPYYGRCMNTSGKHAAMVDAADAMAELSKPRWIPVTERLPDIGSNCLIFSVSGCVAEGQFDGDGWTQYRWSAKFDKDAVTHWVPLPEPPKEEA